MKLTWTEDMGEISGFKAEGDPQGIRYEEACRKMVLAGAKWCIAHPTANPLFKGAEAVFGLVTESNADAKALTKAITKAVPDCSGAMHHAAVLQCLFIQKNGWDAYVKRRRGKKT